MCTSGIDMTVHSNFCSVVVSHKNNTFMSTLCLLCSLNGTDVDTRWTQEDTKPCKRHKHRTSVTWMWHIITECELDQEYKGD